MTAAAARPGTEPVAEDDTAATTGLSIGDWLERVATDPTRATTEVVVEHERTDARTLLADADALASAFLSLGLRSDDRVVVLTPASMASLQTWFALARAGLVEVPLNPASGPLVVRHCVGQVGARAVVCAAGLIPLLREALAGVQHDVAHLVVVDDGTDHPDPATAGWGVEVHHLADLLAHPVVPLPRVEATSTAVILFTSGTTGPPKGARLSHRANVNLALHTVELMGYGADDRLYSVFPLYHSNARYCSVMAGLEAGAGVLLHRRFSATRFWEICRRERITAFNYQGAMLSILFKQPPAADDADNPVRVGFGAPCPAEIFDEFESRFRVALTEIYGSTEVSLVCEMPPRERRVGTAGRESDIYEVAVVDDLDREVPAGTPGEIVARPKRPGWMFDGYEADPAATVAAWRNLWFHTGDRGVLDPDGYLTFLDRVKDTVRRRGENVSTWEVERVIAEHPAVAQVAAYGVASELSEEEVMVAVVPAGEHRPDPADLWRHCEGRLTAFAVPRYVRFVGALPLTPSQRVEKYKLRAEGVTPDSHDREAT